MLTTDWKFILKTPGINDLVANWGGISSDILQESILVCIWTYISGSRTAKTLAEMGR